MRRWPQTEAKNRSTHLQGECSGNALIAKPRCHKQLLVTRFCVCEVSRRHHMTYAVWYKAFSPHLLMMLGYLQNITELSATVYRNIKAAIDYTVLCPKLMKSSQRKKNLKLKILSNLPVLNENSV